jgi:ubiquitin
MKTSIEKKLLAELAKFESELAQYKKAANSEIKATQSQ